MGNIPKSFDQRPPRTLSQAEPAPQPTSSEPLSECMLIMMQSKSAATPKSAATLNLICVLRIIDKLKTCSELPESEPSRS